MPIMNWLQLIELLCWDLLVTLKPSETCQLCFGVNTLSQRRSQVDTTDEYGVNVCLREHLSGKPEEGM